MVQPYVAQPSDFVPFQPYMVVPRILPESKAQDILTILGDQAKTALSVFTHIHLKLGLFITCDSFQGIVTQAQQWVQPAR
jgi:hypothetical protein